MAKRVRNEFTGPLGPGGPKSPKQSRKRVKTNSCSTILTLFRLRFRLFGPPKPRGPGNSFWTLFATLAPKGPNDPCCEQKFSQVQGDNPRLLDETGGRSTSSSPDQKPGQSAQAESTRRGGGLPLSADLWEGIL